MDLSELWRYSLPGYQRGPDILALATGGRPECYAQGGRHQPSVRWRWCYRNSGVR
ncbi:hypothetical protein CCP3SC5AM1_990003 [Gammaproteobacteria bacterium]